VRLPDVCLSCGDIDQRHMPFVSTMAAIPSPLANDSKRVSVAQWTGAHISKSPDPKTEFTGIDGLRTYIRTVPAALLYFAAIWFNAGRYGFEGEQRSKWQCALF